MSGRSPQSIPRIHVVAGVLLNEFHQVLISQRPPGKAMAGAWEFPGGKLASYESPRAGLRRELEEELGVTLTGARPLIRYRHRYPSMEVDLDVWKVTRWLGTPRGREGQSIAWCPVADLGQADLLAADVAIVLAVQLPDCIAVTPPDAAGGPEKFLDALEATAATQRAGLICLRQPDLPPARLIDVAFGAACRLEGSGAKLLVHGDPSVFGPLLTNLPVHLEPRLSQSVAGLHVPERFIGKLRAKPVPERMLFGASCHSREELEAALRLGADYAFLGSVKPTSSHPGSPGLGWERFAEIIEGVALPVYAIGGMGPDDLEEAWSAGAQGIAAIRSLWAGVA